MINSIASTVLMIRPCNFGYNPETAATNIFQNFNALSPSKIQTRALLEFDNFVKLLRENKISLEIFDDTPFPFTPDSIFPNNWFSVHRNNLLIIYPMLAINRRSEKRDDIISFLQTKYSAKKRINLSHFENENKFLEGTGSIVFDHVNKIGYANISSRTNKELVQNVCSLLGYKAIVFSASDLDGSEIYHANVLLCIGQLFAIVCLEAISNKAERESVRNSLENSGLEIVEISFSQMHSFCGNVLELLNADGEKILVMSETAFKGFHEDQLQILKRYATIIFTPLETIETVGGGSARCMLAEIYD